MRRNLHMLPLSFVSILLLSACGKPVGSAGKSVDLPQTAVKKQMGDSCWAYVTAAFLESLYKKRTGQSIDISEDAIVFYSILVRLEGYKNSNFENEERIFSKDDMQGGNVMHSENVSAPNGSASGFDLIERFGVVPESTFPTKIKTSQDVKDTILEIKTRFSAYMKDRKTAGQDPKSIALNDLITHVMVSKNSFFETPPPANFSFGRKRLTPLEFLKSELMFQQRQFKYVDFLMLSGEDISPQEQSGKQYSDFVRLVKSTLASGYAVPFDFDVDSKFLVNDRFTARLPAKSTEPKIKPGGHAVLLTDFVNERGREGAVSATELSKAVKASPEVLDYFQFKNSWGVIPKESKNGYYKIDQSYIKLLLKQRFSFGVVVPKNAQIVE